MYYFVTRMSVTFFCRIENNPYFYHVFLNFYIPMKNKIFSLFRGYSDICPATISLQEIIQQIRESPSLRDHTEKHRYFLSLGNSTAARREKSSCPCFAVAVRFENGKQQKHICGWTGLGMVDIDHIDPERMEEIRRRALDDPHTLLAYTTIGGYGLHVFFRIEGLTDDNHRNLKLYGQAFEQANQYYAALLDCPCDLQCKNATRLSGLAYDPGVYFNPEAQPFVIQPQPEKKEPAQRAGNRLLKKAVSAAKDLLETEQIVYEPHHRNQYIMRMGYLLNEYGVPQEEATQWAIDAFRDYDGDVAGILASCYRHTDEHGTRALPQRYNAGRPQQYAGIEKIEDFLQAQADFRHNVITGQCEIAYATDDPATSRACFRPLTDRDENTLWRRMNKEVGRVYATDIHNLLHSEYVPPYNPLQDYLLNLPPWDGETDHIARLAATVKVKGDQQQFTEYFRKWLVGMLPPLFGAPTVNHEILVLIGAQGSYKTTWFNYLLPPPLRRYFHTKVSNAYCSKDDLFSLTEFMLICLEEIDEMSPAALNQLKAMVTLKSVNERPAYGRNKEHRPHIASFCATGNNPHFLNDPSGNRRWLPFEVENILPPQEHPIDYEGVYAQAMHLWKNGFHYWFDAEDIDTLNRHNLEFEAPNLERELILSHFRPTLPGEKGIFVTTAYVLREINSCIRQPLSPQKVGLLMKQLGFKSIRYGGQRGYRVVQYSGEDIAQNRQSAANFTFDPDAD